MSLKIINLGYILCLSVLLFAGVKIGHAQNDNILQNPNLIRIYLDFEHNYDLDRYIRQEITFVNHVRDPLLAQVHVLITTKHTASQGQQFDLRFLGREKFTGQDQELFYFSPQSNSHDDERRGLVKIIKMGLMSYVGQVSGFDSLFVNYHSLAPGFVSEATDETWDFWVFFIDFSSGFSAQEVNREFNLRGTVRADRVTGLWKVKNEAQYEYEEEKFVEDDQELRSILKRWDVNSEVVYSLSEYWSAGFFANLNSTTYRNIKLGLSLSPAIQYNFFPWSESLHRKFLVGYMAGLRSYKYFEETIYYKMNENLLFHGVVTELEMVQPWGRIDIELQAWHYPQMHDKYSLIADTEISLRLSSNLSLYLDARLEKIHDQIYLPIGDATIDEILLKRRQLATTYDVHYWFGLSFTFGSIYNNVVNDRM